MRTAERFHPQKAADEYCQRLGEYTFITAHLNRFYNFTSCNCNAHYILYRQLPETTYIPYIQQRETR